MEMPIQCDYETLTETAGSSGGLSCFIGLMNPTWISYGLKVSHDPHVYMLR